MNELTKSRLSWLISNQTHDLPRISDRRYVLGRYVKVEHPNGWVSKTWEEDHAADWYYNKADLLKALGSLPLDENGESGIVLKVQYRWISKTHQAPWTYTIFEISWDDKDERRFNAYQAARKKQRKRHDWQKCRVYRMEDDLQWQWEQGPTPVYKLGEAQIQQLYTYVYAQLGIALDRVPRVQVSNRKKTKSGAWPWLRKIKLAAGWGQRFDTVLHELAHCIEDELAEKTDAVTHGRTFVGIVLALYEHFIPNWPSIDEARKACERRNVLWSETDYNTIRLALLGKIQAPIVEKHYVGREVAMAKYEEARQHVV